MFEHDTHPGKKTNKGVGNEEKVKQAFLSELDRMTFESSEQDFDPEELGTMLNWLDKHDPIECTDSLDKDAFKKRLSKNLVEKATLPIKEINIKHKQIKIRSKYLKVAAVILIVSISTSLMNIITLTAENKSLFQFLGEQNDRIVVQIKNNNKPSDVAGVEGGERPKVILKQYEEIEKKELIEKTDFTLYLPNDIPETLFDTFTIMQDKNMVGAEYAYLKYRNKVTGLFFNVWIYTEDQGKGMRFYSSEGEGGGGEFKWFETIKFEDQDVEIYFYGEMYQAFLMIDNVYYQFASNLTKDELVEIIQGMELVTGGGDEK